MQNTFKFHYRPKSIPITFLLLIVFFQNSKSIPKFLKTSTSCPNMNYQFNFFTSSTCSLFPHHHIPTLFTSHSKGHLKDLNIKIDNTIFVKNFRERNIKKDFKIAGKIDSGTYGKLNIVKHRRTRK